MSPRDRLRFHLDESRSPSLAHALRLRGIDVTTSQEAGLLGLPDEDQLAFANTEGRVVVTHDDDFTRLHARDTKHCGIIYCHQNRYSLGEIIRKLVMVWESRETSGLEGRLEYL